MSKQELYRGPADQNPLDLSKVPKEPLDHRFPITTELPTKSSAALLIFRLFLLSLFSIAVLVAMDFASFFIVLAVAFVVFQILMREGSGVQPIFTFGVAFALLAVYGCYFATRLGFPIAMLVLLGVAVLATLLLAALFREHWVTRACCGMLDKNDIQNFYRKARLPRGVWPKPFFSSFAAAFNSWTYYDPVGCQSPGTQPSPAGRAATRVTHLTVVVVLWSGVAVGFGPQLGGVVALPFLILLAVLLPIMAMAFFAGPILGSAKALIDMQFDPSLHRPFTRSLKESTNQHVRESIYLGRVHGDGSPIHCPVSQLWHGGWIQGPPGSGKTVLLMQLIEQLIWQGYSVVTMDLKATSHELYWTACATAQAAQREQGRDVPVHTFTPTHGQGTQLFDLFDQPFWRALSAEEKASCLIGIFGMNYPCVYPQDYFRNAAWFLQRHVTSKYPDISSFHEAARYCDEEMKFAEEPWELSGQVKKHGENPRLILQRLGMADCLNHRPSFRNDVLQSAIQLESLFHTPSVLHCSLPSVSDPVSSSEIGRVLLTSLLHAGAYTKKPSVKVIVLIDEFQRLVSRSIDYVLQQARSSGVGVILTNQNSADLIAVDPNMPGTLAGVTSLQAWIKATDSLGVQQVQSYGGQYIDHLVSVSTRNTSEGSQTTYTHSEQLLDRCSTGLIDRVNSTPNQYFLRLNDAGGYAAYGGQMMVVQSGYHMTKSEYDDLVGRPWPSPTKGMLVNGQHRPPNRPPASSLTGPKPPKTPRTPTRLTG